MFMLGVWPCGCKRVGWLLIGRVVNRGLAGVPVPVRLGNENQIEEGPGIAPYAMGGCAGMGATDQARSAGCVRPARSRPPRAGRTGPAPRS